MSSKDLTFIIQIQSTCVSGAKVNNAENSFLMNKTRQHDFSFLSLINCVLFSFMKAKSMCKATSRQKNKKTL